ncbi:hypothetical protein BN948_00163 [Hydrogenophaga intermedia]|uniref:Uncharacterized protein n=1 Tax=Hydrogenophaga intermedia TaxID=65786 RepID=A0A1L1P960_HYDIT|nr:hypothetical protein [Hydrogenophaga intermedia]CDN85770.1 hypothetical protein BN948_00163 [Hydrogenophaga intermedia]
MRRQQTARLESRLKQLQKIIDESKDHGVIVNAIAKMVAIDVETAKLWGAYAPAKTDITSNGETMQGAFAVPLGDVDPAAWAAAALAQSAGEEAEAERVLNARGVRNEAAPAA